MDNKEILVDASLIEGTGIKGTGKKSNRIEARKNLVSKIIRSFQISSTEYDGQKSIHAIWCFMKSDSYMGRIPYFDITKDFFMVNEEMRGRMLTNIEKLVDDVCGSEESTILEKEITEKEDRDTCREIILKINDHIHLASIQMLEITENAVKQSKEIFDEEIEKSKEILGKEMGQEIEKSKEILGKEMGQEIEKSKEILGKEIKEGLQSTERNYIAILGIFASIITASLGGFNYAAKAFDAVSSAENIPALIGLATIIGMVLVAISGIMGNLIFTVINKAWKWERVILPSVGIVVAGVIMYLLSRFC